MDQEIPVGDTRRPLQPSMRKNRQWTDGGSGAIFRAAGVRMGDDPTKTLSKPGKCLRILVVEDHGDTLQILSRLLSHFGHEVSVADCTQSALEIVQSKQFDVVLCDIGLPDGSGYDVISQVKRKQPVKGVALTGFDKDEDIRRGKEAGFDFHLTKPVDFHELRTVLGQIAS